MSVNLSSLAAPGANQPFIQAFTPPTVSLRNPNVRDKAPIGTMWINRLLNEAYILTSIVNNQANWLLVEGSGGTGVFTTVVASGNITSTAGNIAATAGSVSAGTTVTAGTGITSTTGNIVATAGAVSAGTTVTAGTTMTAGTGITATLGNITLTNGNLVLSTATTGITLPGPVRIITGAGAPAAGLAVNVGDMYINTTAASATTRIYMATAASTWTNFTMAA